MTAKGKDGFEAHYSELFGTRWPGLKEALLLRSRDTRMGRVIRENAFANEETRRRAFETLQLGPLPGTWRLADDRPALARDEDGLVLGYVMDPASILAARALDLSNADDVWDVCAAPGGKSLILCEHLGEEARLTANDRSRDRLTRLRRVFDDYLPPSLRERIKLSGLDGRKLGMVRRQRVDRILLDAPCSSEAHVLADEQALAEWSTSRIRRLAQEQYALLTSALLALRPGGRLVYSTCALGPEENDHVLERLLTKGRHPVRVVPPEDPPLGARTHYGVQVLPDEHGFGPIYYATLESLEGGS